MLCCRPLNTTQHMSFCTCTACLVLVCPLSCNDTHTFHICVVVRYLHNTLSKRVQTLWHITTAVCRSNLYHTIRIFIFSNFLLVSILLPFQFCFVDTCLRPRGVCTVPTSLCPARVPWRRGHLQRVTAASTTPMLLLCCVTVDGMRVWMWLICLSPQRAEEEEC